MRYVVLLVVGVLLAGFSLVLTHRVITYVALMRDEYPPFHLDQGGADPWAGGTPAPDIEPELLSLGG
jgi:hypothetical protein